MARLIAVSILTFLVAPTAFAQGIRMSPDFLPLDVGNLWRYEIQDSAGAVIDDFEIEILQHTIVDGRSMYVFSQFPLAPGVQAGRPVGVRYDRDRRQYLRFDGELEDDLFPSLGASMEVVETDSDGLALRVVFDYGAIALTLERGVGIVEATPGAAGPQQAIKLIGARIGSELIGDVTSRQEQTALERGPEPMDPGDLSENVATLSEANPVLILEAKPESGGHRFVLQVQNTADKLLPFNFTTSQSFDFVVLDTSNGQEVWRWSRRMFFSQVIRSEAIRPGGQWLFEAVWNHRDDNLDDVGPGTYEVFALLTTEGTSVRSDPLEFEVP